MEKVSHGECYKCGMEIICTDPTGCNRHYWIAHHIDPNDCIALLKEKIEVLEANLKKPEYNGEF